MIRVYNIPKTYTENMLKEEWVDFKYKKIFFASNDNIYSAGWLFLEFNSKTEQEYFTQYFRCFDENDYFYKKI